jgi:hypothetical protein
MWSYAADYLTHYHYVLPKYSDNSTYPTLHIRSFTTSDFKKQKNVDWLPVTFLRNDVTSSDVCADDVTCNHDLLLRPQFAEFPRSFSKHFLAGFQHKAFHCYDSVLGIISNPLLLFRMPEILPLGQCS